RFPLARLGLALRRGFGSSRILLGRLLIFVAAIIRDIKTAPLENQTSARADFFLHLAAPPLLFYAKVLGTNGERLLRHGLKFLKFMPALRASVFVGRHSQFSIYVCGF